MYQPFLATVVDGINKYSEGATILPAPVHDQTWMMARYQDICIYITKAQAMEFFGLVDPKDIMAVQGVCNAAVAAVLPPSTTPAVIDWDILYLKSGEGSSIQYDQYEAKDRVEAIEAFRAYRGDVPYIISVTKHETDLNDTDI